MNPIPRSLRLLALSFMFMLAACQPSDQDGGTADAVPEDGIARSITGAGASFVYPVMAKWSSDYRTSSGRQVNYQSVGSGGGIAQIKAGTVDFGSSDAPLSSEDLLASGLAQFPSVIGGVVPVVNIDGITPGALRLTGPVLADVFLGKITRWNDAALVELNPDLALPDQAITVVHRADGSGTTFNFANYLAKVSADWKAGPGEGTAVRWPTGIGGKGNEGVAAYVQQVKGSIGYVEFSYAKQNAMSHVALRNAAGNFVEPTSESFAAAAESADWQNTADFDLVLTDAPGADAWPIAATNFVLVHRNPKDASRGAATRAFFEWIYANGDAEAAALDYVPLPDALVTRIQEYWQATLDN
ncbi:phosphate ABC transporter substrate-binding protein PstS [Denitratimonas sp. CY0512]|uniref:phosphate ABC transporter substrate-binding protein PstS n=1 Tax=Denitratimonas sp. CY0512 TaxID=3131940 RepID=UPI0030A6637E